MGRRLCRCVGKYVSFSSACLLALGAMIEPSSAEATETPDTPHSFVGSYLAGRMAKSNNETRNAADFYRAALQFDPKSGQLLEQAFLAEASEANWPRALELAQELVAIEPQHRIAQLVIGLNDFKDGNLKGADEHIKAAATGPIGELTSALAQAWVKVAQQDVSAGLNLLEVPKQAEWAQFYLRYHRALIADIGGRRGEARGAYERVFRQDNRTIRTSLAYARSAANAGDFKLAKSVLNENLEGAQGEGHPLIRALREEVGQNRKTALLVTKPSEGLSEVFYGLGEALIGEGAVAVGTLYLQMALMVSPDQPFALAALANALETNRRYQDAIDVYDRIAKGSPLASAIEIRKAFNLNSLDRVDEARGVLTRLLSNEGSVAAGAAVASEVVPAAEAEAPETVKLGKGEFLKLGSRGEGVRAVQTKLSELGYPIGDIDGAFGESTRKAVIAFQRRQSIEPDGVVGPATFAAITGEAALSSKADASESGGSSAASLDVNTRLQVYDALGNILRSRKRYAEAIEDYNTAIALITKPERRHWGFYYARGTSFERVKNWSAAESDLKKALSLYPDQPLILNYLGYSWVDQGVNLKEGMSLIEKAVQLKPDDGYIVDSLGWAHYKLGNYADATRFLERAVELRPDDPVLNDHLGDALWRVGREREAKFQWTQALALKPEVADVAKIKKKLSEGLAEAPDASLPKKTKEAAHTETPPLR